MRSKRMNVRKNFCEVIKTIMAGSESRTSTCKYKDGNGDKDEEWYAKGPNDVAKF
jgi:hypothetical protein